MEGELLKVLKRFRDEEDPEMGLYEDKPYETLSNAQCIQILEKHGIDALEMCRLGNINIYAN